MKSFLLAALFMTSAVTATHALEIDEKLTLRFLKVSNSKKTILINRGAEDGLAVGDHAKFFITSGVIARGVVEKVSPSRSIWSLYRVVDPAEITDGKVLNLKISSPVKITEDPSKSLKDEPIPGGSEKMDMNDAGAAAGADADVPVLDDADQKELEGLGIEEEKPAPKTNRKASTSVKKNTSDTITVETISSGNLFNDRDWELWGTLNMSMLSGTTTDEANTTNSSTDVTNSRVDLTAGLEKYFSRSDSEFWRNVSVQGFGTMQMTKSGGGTTATAQHLDIGLGGSYHFFNPTNAINRFIGFGNISFGLGQNTLTTESDTTSTELTGSENFFSIGLGTKYYVSNGIGFRAILDFYHQSSGLDYPAQGTTEERTVTTDLNGFRFQMGLSYRF